MAAITWCYEREMMNGWKAAAILWTGFSAIACGQNDGTQSATEATEPLFLFKDPATAGPRLDVYEIDGRAAVSVSGPIGTEGQIAGVSGRESLGELYRVIHPDTAEAPKELVALNERVMSERAEVDGSPRPAVKAPEIAKSESAFKAAACRDFIGGGATYTLIDCLWNPNTNDLRVVGVARNDRVYAWNNNPRKATLEHRLVSGFLWGSATIPEYWWTYATITRDGPFMFVDLLPAGGVRGELGLTHHEYNPIIH